MLANLLQNFFKKEAISLKNKKLLVAASAGPDSMALLALLKNLQAQVPFTLIAAHFDHQLRADSSQESLVLRHFCEQQAIMLWENSWPQAQHPQTGIEAAARKARYAFLTQTAQKENCDYILTAHHGDDLLENILLKLIRSGNPSEMAELLPVTQIGGLTVLRPLLTASKQELLNFDQKKGIDFVLDQSNFTEQTLRNRLRHQVLPLLKKENPQLLNHARNFQQQMRAYQSLLPLPANEDFLPAVRIQKKVLEQYDFDQQSLLLATIIWRKWHQRRQLHFQGRKLEIADYLILPYGRYYYLLAKKDLPASNFKQAIYCDEPFEFNGRRLLLTQKRRSQSEIGSFYACPTAFTAQNQVAKFLAKSGRHIKAKKKFAQHQVPSLLRPFCLSIWAHGRSVFTEHAYQNQVYPDSASLYFLYEL